MHPTSSSPASSSPFYTPSGRYFAAAADARFWTTLEQEREARELERQQQHETPDEARRRRLEDEVQRWERIVQHYRARGQRTQLRHAVQVLDRARAAPDTAYLVGA